MDRQGFARIGFVFALAAAPLAAHALDVEAVVDCRLEIERILDGRRAWPEANPSAKPAFDALIARHQVARSVATMLLDASRLPAIDAPALQAELDRMATATQDPGLLREMFAVAKHGEHAALCIALPSLVARARAGDVSRQPAHEFDLDAREVTLPEIRVKGGAGIDLRQEPPDPRFGHVAVWTGAEMVVFGGANFNRSFGNGARYFPATDSWLPLPATGAPSPRNLASAVWSGLDVIVFGGQAPSGTMAPDHARYRPSSDAWTPLPAANAPSGRYFHTAVWTGTSMIVFGGTDNGSVFADGGTYTPVSNTWQALPAPPPGNQRQRAAAAWTGTEMLVFGGISGASTGLLASGLRFTPGTPGTWSAMGTASAPSPRALHTGLWFGAPVSRFVVWGGETNSGFGGDGALYDPSGNGWTPMASAGAPEGRVLHSAVSTGAEMIVWGGLTGLASPVAGARYSPASNAWVGAVQPVGNPGMRHQHTAVWTGDAMIVWGGIAASLPLHSGGRYSPGGNAWSPTWTPRPCSTFAGNLVPNCGFESGSTGWGSVERGPPVPLDQLVYRGGAFSGSRNAALIGARSGSKETSVAKQSGLLLLGSPCFPIAGGQRHEYGAYLRRNDNADVMCEFRFDASTATDCSAPSTASIIPVTFNGPDDWHLVRGVSFPSAPAAVAAHVSVNCISSGPLTLHLDDAFALPLGDALFSDGFE